MTPATQWSADPRQSTVGTLTLTAANGSAVDLIANKSIRSGQIAAYIEMRDHVLVEAQNQLDEMAAAMAQALSDETVASAPAAFGAQAGYRNRHRGLAGRQRDQPDLHRSSDQPAAPYHDHPGRRSGRAAAGQHGDGRSQR